MSRVGRVRGQQGERAAGREDETSRIDRWKVEKLEKKNRKGRIGEGLKGQKDRILKGWEYGNQRGWDGMKGWEILKKKRQGRRGEGRE